MVTCLKWVFLIGLKLWLYNNILYTLHILRVWNTTNWNINMLYQKTVWDFSTGSIAPDQSKSGLASYLNWFFIATVFKTMRISYREHWNTGSVLSDVKMKLFIELHQTVTKSHNTQASTCIYHYHMYTETCLNQTLNKHSM